MAFEQLQALVQVTENSKALSPICGQEIIVYPIKLLAQLHIPTTLVVDSESKELRSLLTHHVGDTLTYATPTTQQDTWYQEHILVMHGALPLLTSGIIQELYLQHLQTEATITHAGSADMYIAQRTLLELYALQEMGADAYTCRSVVNYAEQQGHKVTSAPLASDRLHAIRTLKDLVHAEQIKRTDIINYWLDNNVYVACTQTTHVDSTVTIGSGTTIGAGVHIKGDTTIGNNCTIKEYSIIDNSTIGDNVQVGPFAHIKEQSYIQEHAIIGNFVEVKKTTIGSYTKAKHLSYLGDANIGSQVNIGAGTITCNHNGVSKQKTTIHDNAYVGANNTLIAPVTIGEQAFTAAGSVITHDVPAHALAIGRARQVVKEGYAHKLRSNKQETVLEQAFKAAIKTDNTTPSSENA